MYLQVPPPCDSNSTGPLRHPNFVRKDFVPRIRDAWTNQRHVFISKSCPPVFLIKSIPNLILPACLTHDNYLEPWLQKCFWGLVEHRAASFFPACILQSSLHFCSSAWSWVMPSSSCCQCVCSQDIAYPQVSSNMLSSTSAYEAGKLKSLGRHLHR